MSRAAPVSLVNRQAAYDAACRALDGLAAAWLDARVTGQCSPSVQAQLDDAMAAVRRTERALTRALKRIK